MNVTTATDWMMVVFLGTLCMCFLAFCVSVTMWVCMWMLGGSL